MKNKDLKDRLETLCKVCGKGTKTIYNINLKATHICESCARQIAHQEISDMFRLLSSKEETHEK